jgi:hypothetical protein
MTDSNQSAADLRGATVRFRVADVLLPPADELMLQLFGENVLQGCVVDQSGASGSSDAHLAVKIEGLADPVLVCRSRLMAEPLPG